MCVSNLRIRAVQVSNLDEGYINIIQNMKKICMVLNEMIEKNDIVYDPHYPHQFLKKK